MSCPTKFVPAWRTMPIVAWLCLVALVIAACAQPESSPPAAEATNGDEAPAAAVAGVDLPQDAAPEQVLRISTGSTGSASFDFYPMQGGSDNQSWMPLLHAPPLYFDVDLELQPGVFEDWESNEEFTEWVFSIDPRAQFSDGSPITAADVKRTWEYMARPDSDHGRITQYAGNIVGFVGIRDGDTDVMEGLTVVDDSTLQVNLENPDAIFHWRIATTHMNPLKLDGVDTDNQSTFWLPENDPLYSGPYMLESYNSEQRTATLVPNPNWWMDEGPYLERIEFRFQPEPETIAALIQNNEIDASLSAAPFFMRDDFPDYFRPTRSFGFNSLWLAATVEPTDDVNVRKALVLAVDDEAVFNAAFTEGDSVQATQLLDPDLPCLETEQSWYPYDPEAARQAIADSSYGSVENLPRIRVTPRGTSQINTRAVEAAMEFWRQNLDLVNIEFQQSPDGFGEDAEIINLSRDDVVIRFPDSATYMWAAAHSAGPIASGDMLKGYENEEIDAILEEALTLSVDDPRRCELALEAQRLFLDDYPIIFMGIGIPTLNAREYVVDYEKGPDVGLIAPWRIYIREH